MWDKWGGSKWRGSRGPGVLAGPGTPRDPKSHLFATKWVAIPPFGTLKPGSGTEFRPGSRRGGPGPKYQLFFRLFWTQKCPKVYFLGGFRIYLRPIAMDLGPQGPKGAQGGPRGPLGAPRAALGVPKGPKRAKGAPWAPKGPLGPCWGVPLRAVYIGFFH